MFVVDQLYVYRNINTVEANVITDLLTVNIYLISRGGQLF